MSTQEWISAAEFARRNHGVIGRTLVDDAIRRGDIPSVRLGRRILVPADALDRLLADIEKIRRSGAGVH